MQQVQKGDNVSVHYHGRLIDGSTFDSSEGREPLQFTAGSGQVIPGFDEAVLGMLIGDKKTVHIPVDNAYGQRNEDMVMPYPKSDFPEDMQPAVGMQLQMGDNAGNVFPVTIVEVTEDSVLLDANHELAGHDLIFEIELVTIG